MRPNLFFLAALESVVVLVALLVLVRRRTLTTRAMMWVAFASLLLVAGFIAWVAASLLAAWLDPQCRVCLVNLPPFSTFWYRESFGRYGAYFGVNIATGLLFGLGFWLFARRTKGEVIDGDDVFLLTLAGAMIGWPNILLFLAALFFVSVAVFLVKRRFRDRVTNPRVIITPLIPFAALPIILWGDWLAARLGFYDLGLVAITLVKP